MCRVTAHNTIGYVPYLALTVLNTELVWGISHIF